MNIKSNLFQNRMIIMIAILFGLGLFIAGLFLLWLIRPNSSQVVSSAIVTVIPLATKTESGLTEDQSANGGLQTPTVVIVDGVQIGSVVQITGTGGAGLRLREDPGVSSSVQFIGDELELFEVKDGPVEIDQYLWWYLESPYDSTRSGWAASSYLSVIAEQ